MCDRSLLSEIPTVCGLHGTFSIGISDTQSLRADYKIFRQQNPFASIPTMCGQIRRTKCTHAQNKFQDGTAWSGEKKLGGHHSSEETTDPPPHEEVEIPQTQPEEEEGDVVEIVTTTGDCDVVEEGHFTSESAQILIGEIMGCNRDLENIKQNINDVQNKMKNIIDVLGRI
ncbi:hypothetical protein AB205_0207980 [Aquarana catesbeiana]|uniref:Uncharacterized protein n=1 Tax=Aquarana catesbeiana TaxID=8400 RepID=A0A2G9S3B9_AQUCT|nr:hypothetical protein AB205_0207980 [Aquarana catesbeiana]